ncbi:hypothetical protein AEAC466_17810 [Asticcacaulis sp. AC466]|uniref:DUF805 domain-containing protein n=1 Tax=Asticcacaulis sp. AC466 TaxID=1282362 RepID=UPI0003C40364|nr:DUF805 domain-containing protein [Asticcacaulis sp. AC466]ESQ82462.1 hypothetical protein AEAC466_17810 [Asticcacaulis sp. AC466]
MTPKIDWSELFFSSTGRAGQVPSIIAAGVLLLFLAVYESVVTGALQFLNWIVYPVLIYCGACVVSKRLHDRGRSGWWAAIILLAVVMVWPRPTGFFDFIAVFVLVWAVIDLCVMPGERGDNRYGRTLFRTAMRES